MALAFRFAKHVVIFAGRILRKRSQNFPLVLPIAKVAFRLRQLLPVLSVEPPHIVLDAPMLFVIDVVIKVIHAKIGLILDFDARALAVRHREIANERVSSRWSGRQRKGNEVVLHAPSLAKEITNRALNRRMLLPVPKHPKDQVSAQQRIAPRDRDPDVLDDPGALHLRQNAGGTRFDGNGISVSSRSIVRRNSSRLCVNDLGDVSERLRLVAVNRWLSGAVPRGKLCANTVGAAIP